MSSDEQTDCIQDGTQLKSAISDVASNIAVDDISDFPSAPGRLVLEDNTANREVVIYNAIDAVNNEFTNVTRGAEVARGGVAARRFRVEASTVRLRFRSWVL